MEQKRNLKDVNLKFTRKKCLLYLSKESGKPEWDLYGTECDIKNKKFSIIDKGIRVNAIKYWKKHRSLIRIWNGINPEEEKEPQYGKAKEYIFSNEIHLFYTIYDEKLFIELFADSVEGISTYQSEKYSVEELLSMLEDKLQMNRDDIPVKYYRQLQLLFEMVRKQKYIKYNQLAEMMERMSKRGTQRQRDIQNALTKKHFSSKEEQKIFQYLIAPVRNEFYGTNMPRCVEKSIGLQKRKKDKTRKIHVDNFLKTRTESR